MKDIQLGEAYRVGDHIVACGDFLEQDGRDLLAQCLEQSSPSLIYSDPPRNLRWLKDGYKSTGREASTYPEFVERLLGTIAECRCRGSVFIEHAPVGGRYEFPIAEAAARAGGAIVKEWPTTYRDGEYRARLLQMRFGTIRPEALGIDVSGFDARELVTAVMDQHDPNQVALDICTWHKGGVWIAEAALDAQHRYVGLKVNPGRAKEHLSYLTRRTGAAPERIV